jgi:hypothetical protein
MQTYNHICNVGISIYLRKYFKNLLHEYNDALQDTRNKFKGWSFCRLEFSALGTRAYGSL